MDPDDREELEKAIESLNKSYLETYLTFRDPCKVEAKSTPNPRTPLWKSEGSSVRKRSFQRISGSSDTKSRNQKNIDILQQRFVGLKTFKAKAALTLADHKIEKAMVLLEVSSAYRELPPKNNNPTYLKNIHIDMLYDNGPKPAAKLKVEMENVSIDDLNQSEVENESTESSVCVFSGVNTSSSSDGKKIGVFISKSSHGDYMATSL